LDGLPVSRNHERLCTLGSSGAFFGKDFDLTGEDDLIDRAVNASRGAEMAQTKKVPATEIQEPLVFQLRELVIPQEPEVASYGGRTQSSCGGEDTLYDGLS
jgi:hypothetical protein